MGGQFFSAYCQRKRPILKRVSEHARIGGAVFSFPSPKGDGVEEIGVAIWAARGGCFHFVFVVIFLRRVKYAAFLQ